MPTPLIVVLLISEGLVLAGLIVYGAHRANTNVEHLRSFTPICPNCSAEIRARQDNEPNKKARLRDHLKVCES